MRRHSTHVDRHSTTSSRHSVAWDNARSMGRGLNGWRLTECLLIEMYHDVSYDPWYLWICTTHIQPPHVQYVAWKWCVHTTYTHILICSRYFSRCQSEIIQHRTCHLEAVWACMDNLILRIFFSLEFFALLDWTTTGTVQSVDFVLRVFYLKATSREYFLVKSTISNACVLCFGLWVRIWRSPSTSNATKGCRSDVKLQSFHKFQHSLWTLPWKLMASSGLWPWGSRRACLWEIELQPNQHC